MAEPKDLTGQRFGKLVVLSLAEPRVCPSGQKQRRWLCHCDCGNDKIINQQDLLRGSAKTCGCGKIMRGRDRTGERYGRWTVLGRAPLEKATHNGQKYGWLCRCDCGTERVLSTQDLIQTKSCGCLLSDTAKVKNDKNQINVMGFANRTALVKIQPGLPATKASTTGVRGVFWSKSKQRYIACVTYQRKTYHLGTFIHIEDAIAARKCGEEQIFAPAREEVKKILEEQSAQKKQENKSKK